MEEIKVGEYVITQNRLVIGKILEIENDDKILIKTETSEIHIGKWNIKRHSFNIIDLIGVGDIVETFDVLNNDVIYIWSEDMLKAVKEDVENGIQLKSILTKEQYENIKYEVIK